MGSFASLHTCGCINSAGTVVNNESTCGVCVHVNCNAAVGSVTVVLDSMKIKSVRVSDKKAERNELLCNSQDRSE